MVPAVEGDWPRTGPWHYNGWIEEFVMYSYCGHYNSVDPFGDRELNNSGVPLKTKKRYWQNIFILQIKYYGIG